MLGIVSIKCLSVDMFGIVVVFKSLNLIFSKHLLVDIFHFVVLLSLQSPGCVLMILGD